jgi:hypothetical protein
MQPIEMSDQPAPVQRDMPVQILFECRPAEIGKWIDHVWDAVGVVVGELPPDHREEEPVWSDESGVQQFLVGGLRLQLHVDECESYYHNLMSPEPRCYIVAHVEDSNDRPRPFVVSMSFDEAHAYLEGEEEIYSVGIPPVIYQWTEAFVLSFYAPEQRRKRKRVDWSQPGGRA